MVDFKTTNGKGNEMRTNTEMTIEEARDYLKNYCIDPPPEGAAERLQAAAADGLNLDADENQDAIDAVIYEV